MKIVKKRIVNVKKYLTDLKDNDRFYIGITLNANRINKIKNDFDYLDKANLIVVPRPYLGINSQRNAVGECIPDKSKHKIIDYRASTYRLKDWGGYWHEGTCEIPYSKYPSIFIEPQNFKFQIIKSNKKEILIVNQEFINEEAEYKNIKFCFNLFLEIFKEVETYTMDRNSFQLKVPLKEVDWEILPKGTKIWESFKNKKLFNKISLSSQKLLKDRFEYIETFKPNREFQGKAGYTGYVVFCFDSERIYVLDSIIYGNATYIFSDKWENFSKLTKKDIIMNHYEKARIIHSNDWRKRLAKELKSVLPQKI